MKIAIYSIALNEAKHVAQFMKAAQEADLVLIADRGSSDNTIQLLKEHGAEVHSIKINPFRFDVARNKALALVPEEFDCLIALDFRVHSLFPYPAIFPYRGFHFDL